MIKLIVQHLKGSAKFWAISAPIMMLIEVVMDLLQPTLMSKIIDIGVANGNLAYVVHTGLIMIATTVAGFAGGALCSIFAARAAVSMSGEMRLRLFRTVQGFSFAEVDDFKTSSLVTRLTNDVMQMQQMLLMTLRIMVRSPFTFLGSIVMAFILSPRLAIIFAVILPVVATGVIIVMKKSATIFALVQKSLDRINTIMRENLLGARVVKAFTIEGDQEKRFVESNDELTDMNIKAQSLTFLLLPLVTLVMNLGVVFVLWNGGNMVMKDGIEVGKIMAFINYLVQITNSLMMAVNLVVNISRAQASADRINEVLAAKPAITEPQEPRRISNFDIEFRNVSFGYRRSGALALRNISFAAKQGETIGIIGATGSGKSTLACLIPRLYDVTEGQILLGGTDIRNLSLRELRRRIGIVMQESVLFSGTVEENLRFGNDHATGEDLDRACEAAQGIDFLKAKRAPGDGGYGGSVEQRGRNFSGGQKQRFSIARTLIQNPDILILDDSTSAIDLATESRMRKAIAERIRGKTLIVIAQRISAVMGADRIIVLDSGRIAAYGTHRELIASSDIYRSIVISQLGEEAIENV
jgi:ATP-binding cassette subfamily B protein